MDVTIHFVRHGEVANPHGMRYGRQPGFHLSAAGHKQVQNLTAWLTRYPIAAIFSSPLERAQQTATLIGQAFPLASITLDDRLNENKTPSEFEGESRDRPFVFPETTNRDGETSDQIIARLTDFCRDVGQDFHGRHIVAVSHGDPIGLLYHHLAFDRRDDPGAILYPGYASDWQFVFAAGQLTVWAAFVTPAGRIRL